MLARMVVFQAPKQGHDECEWEDGAAADPGDPASGRNARFAVADGATEGFGSARWAQHLVAGFVGLDGTDGDDAEAPPALRRDELHRWLARAQADCRHSKQLFPRPPRPPPC